jgi:hypothetical protein
MAGSPEYLLAMKVLADRNDRDREDLRFLIRLLGLKSVKQAERLFSEVYPDDEIPDDTRARLTELIAQEAAG